MHNDPYTHLLAHLFARSAMGMRPGLDPTRALLAALGHPEAHLPYVLVAGTNGKGSTSACIAAALTQAGRRTGLFTSPHLLSFGERIRIDGAPLSPEALLRIYPRLLEAEVGLVRPATFFEASLAIACIAFADAGVNIAVIEVGLGGLLDATNALPDATRKLTCITPIDLDHQHILGESLAAIAEQKAGIMRPGVPVVVAPQQPVARDVLAATAAKTGAGSWHDVPQVAYAPFGLPGGDRLPPYLQQNCATARVACEVLHGLGMGCDPAHWNIARRAFVWPGRYQALDAKVAGGPAYLIDGSHNPAGMAALVAAIKLDARLAHKTLHALFAVMPHKDLQAMEATLRPHVAQVVTCALHINRPAQVGSKKAQHPRPDYPSAKAALKALSQHLGPDDVILVTGSLYLAGEALGALCSLPADPPVWG